MRSIERYLLAWVLGALALSALIVVVVTYLVTLDEMNEVYDADLRHVAESLGSYRPVELVPDLAARLPVRTDVADSEEIITITWTSDGRRVYSSDPRVQMPFINHEALTRQQVGGEEWIVYTDVSDNGIAQAAQRAAARRETAVEAASKLFPPMVGVGVLVTALMLLALRRGLRPLDGAARDIAARSAKSLAPMAIGEVPREISPLVQALNGLLARLAEALNSQRRFVADAAHELRTPMTALRLQLQLLQRSADEASRQNALAELGAGIERSQHLVEQLLDVARSEPDAEPQRDEAVDLAALVRSVVGGASPLAEQRGIDLGAVAGPPAVVQGDAMALTVLLNNLVQNALRYTPAGGVVDVEAVVHDGHPALRVIDNGPGIPAAERERVFDRFYRGADAPAMARDGGGSGLGLAIVRAIAERHAAVVRLLTPASGAGLEVRVDFPAAA